MKGRCSGIARLRRRGRSTRMSGRTHWSRRWSMVGVLLLVLAGLGLAPGAALAKDNTGTYTNPLSIRIPGDGFVESCADPSVIRGQQSDDSYWYMYCTKDPLNDEDKTNGNFNFH